MDAGRIHRLVSQFTAVQTATAIVLMSLSNGSPSITHITGPHVTPKPPVCVDCGERGDRGTTSAADVARARGRPVMVRGVGTLSSQRPHRYAG
jgi:hypothetical protein